jgi:hypothetical protein
VPFENRSGAACVVLLESTEYWSDLPANPIRKRPVVSKRKSKRKDRKAQREEQKYEKRNSKSEKTETKRDTEYEIDAALGYGK